MARPVEPEEQPPAPPPPAADLLPELQARIELATRQLSILERRIASWESDLAAVKTELRDSVEPEDVPDAARFSDLEARVSRLERRHLRLYARETAADAAIAAAAAAAEVPIEVADDTKAIVFARWSSTEAQSGETVKLSAMLDGFNADEAVTFTIIGLDGTRPYDPIVVPAGASDTVQVKWNAPKLGQAKAAEFYFEASAGPLVARSPVLSVRKG